MWDDYKSHLLAALSLQANIPIYRLEMGLLNEREEQRLLEQVNEHPEIAGAVERFVWGA